MRKQEDIENSKSSKKFKKQTKKKNENTKSCPKCAKINELNAKKCVSCGFNFEKKSKRGLISIIFCLVVMGVLSLLVYFDVSFVKDNLWILIYAVGGIGIFSIIYSTLFYAEDEKIAYSAEEQMTKKSLSKFKKVSIVFAIIGVSLLIVFCIYLVLSYLGIN